MQDLEASTYPMSPLQATDQKLDPLNADEPIEVPQAVQPKPQKPAKEVLADDPAVNEFLLHMHKDPSQFPAGQHERIKQDLWKVINHRQSWLGHYYKISLVVGMIGQTSQHLISGFSNHLIAPVNISLSILTFVLSFILEIIIRTEYFDIKESDLNPGMMKTLPTLHKRRFFSLL